LARALRETPRNTSFFHKDDKRIREVAAAYLYLEDEISEAGSYCEEARKRGFAHGVISALQGPAPRAALDSRAPSGQGAQ
jgi:hypothetical protein